MFHSTVTEIKRHFMKYSINKQLIYFRHFKIKFLCYLMLKYCTKLFASKKMRNL